MPVIQCLVSNQVWMYMSWFKRTPKTTEVAQPVEEKSFFTRLVDGLTKTRTLWGSEQLNAIFGRKEIDDELFEQLETLLLKADVGVETTERILAHLTAQLKRKELKDPQALKEALQDYLTEILRPCEKPLEMSTHKPFVILMVGVNGAGKTTTIGKMAKRFQSEGKSVLLAAGDTFRAAAVEQLQVWGERNKIPVIAQASSSDSASVIYDAMQAAKARNIDVLIADTAGRLQNKTHLMEELKKVVRVIKKVDPQAPHEILLVIDAGMGQNALSQAKLFHEAVGVTGIALTKLDGTAKGGIMFAIADTLKIPIRFIGIGEKIDDLRPFEVDDFIAALEG